MAKLKDGYFKNIGSAEGNDSYALLAGGGHLSYSNSGGANALVQRDANGYIVNNYFNTTGGGSEKNASGLGYIAGFNTSDYYIRSYTSAAVKSWLGLGSNAYTSTAYLPLSGGTITGALNFHNGTWNNVGDDVAIGDINVSGQLGIKALNTANPGIAFYNNSAVAVGNLISNAGTLQWSGNTIWHAGNLTPSNYLLLSGGTMTGQLILNGLVTGDFNNGIRINKDSANWSSLMLGGPIGQTSGHNGTTNWFVATNPSSVFMINPINSSTGSGLDLYRNGEAKWRGNTIWHSGNDGAGSGLDADLLDGVQSKYYLPSQAYHYTNGILVTTSIAAISNQMVTVKIIGNDYGNEQRGIDTIIQFYNYDNGNAILSYGATNNGYNFGNIKVFNYNGKVCLWFQQGGSYQTYYITAYAGITNAVESITNETMPTAGVTREVTIVPKQSALVTDNVASATKLSTDRTNWSYNGVINNVVGQLVWRHYGNNHTIFDASNGYTPTGAACGKENSDIAWTQSYPTLMGYNGNETYGVRVDSSRIADRLRTGRYIFGQYFDGTGNVSGDLTGVGSITASGNISVGGAGVFGSTLGALSIGVSNVDSSSGRGLSLYGGAESGKPTYGIMFAGTGTFGTHGGVTDSWATYLTTSDTLNRGWIFQRGSTNVASISGNGDAKFDGTLNVVGAATATNFSLGNNNQIRTNSGYLELASAGNEICMGGTDGTMFVNYRPASNGTPTTWRWLAGSSTSFADFYVGGLVAGSSITTAGYVSSAVGYYKTGFSNDDVLLAGGGAAAISGLSVSYATTASNSYYQVSTGISNDWVTSFQNTPAHATSFREMFAGGPSGTWWFMQNFRHSNGDNYWGRQIAWGWEDNAHEMYSRNITENSFSGWVRFLNSSNYNSFSPTLTGGGASGTWGINISGNAATASTATTANTASKTNGISGYAHAGAGMYAFYNWGGSDGGASAPNDSTYTIGISVGSHPGDQSYGFQIGRNMWNTGLWTRGYDSGWGTWYRILDSGNYSSYSPTLTGGGASGTWGISITGNASTATKLQTERTIWGQNFDGSGNVSGALSEVSTISASGFIVGSNFLTSNSPNYSLILRQSTKAALFVQNSAIGITAQIASFRYGSATAGAGTSVLNINTDSIVSSVGYSKAGYNDSVVLLGGGGTCSRGDVLPYVWGNLTVVNSSYITQSSVKAYQLGHIVILQGTFTTRGSASNGAAYFTIPSSIGAPFDDTGWDSSAGNQNTGIRMNIPVGSRTIYLTWNDTGTNTTYQMSWVYYCSYSA